MEYLPKTENADVSEWSKMTGERGENRKKILRINHNKTAVLAKLINGNRSQNSGHLGGMRKGQCLGRGTGEVSGVLEMFLILIQMVVTQVKKWKVELS